MAWRGLLLGVLAVLGLASLFALSRIGDGDEESGRRATDAPAIEQEPQLDPRQKAARLGTGWLIDQVDRIQQPLPVLIRLYRVSPDDALADRLAALIRATRKRLRSAEVHHTLEGTEESAWRDAHTLVSVAQVQQLRGQPHEETLGRLEALVSEHDAGFGTAPLRPGAKLVVLYFLEQFGIPSSTTSADYLATMRAAGDAFADPTQPAFLAELFAVTHVVLTASHYFRTYLEPERFAPEVRRLRRAVAYFLEDPTRIDDASADVLSEVLVCYRLLRLPPDEQARELSSLLRARQHEDGSWGRWPGRVHHTFVSTLAMMRFPSAFRDDAAVLHPD